MTQMIDEPHCETCRCGKRAPTQGSREYGKPEGTIAWPEHERAWSVYASRYGESQSAERIAERGGFGYEELCELIGRAPSTWRPGPT